MHGEPPSLRALEIRLHQEGLSQRTLGKPRRSLGRQKIIRIVCGRRRVVAAFRMFPFNSKTSFSR